MGARPPKPGRLFFVELRRCASRHFSLVLLFMVSLKRKDERGHTSGIRTLKRKDERGHDDLNGYAKAYNKMLSATPRHRTGTQHMHSTHCSSARKPPPRIRGRSSGSSGRHRRHGRHAWLPHATASRMRRAPLPWLAGRATHPRNSRAYFRVPLPGPRTAVAVVWFTTVHS